MNLKFVKKLVTIKGKDGKQDLNFYTFYLQLENGMELRVLPNEYTDKEKVKHSNYRELLLVAQDVIPF